MGWLCLIAGIMLDVGGTVFLKLSDGLRRGQPAALMVLCYLGSLLPMAVALRYLSISTVYAVWSAAGTALAILVGLVYFHEETTTLKLVSFALILAGVLLLNLNRQAN